MEDVGPQLGGVVVPVAIDLPAGSGQIVAISAAPTRDRLMARLQLLVGTHVHRRYGDA